MPLAENDEAFKIATSKQLEGRLVTRKDGSKRWDAPRYKHFAFAGFKGEIAEAELDDAIDAEFLEPYCDDWMWR